MIEINQAIQKNFVVALMRFYLFFFYEVPPFHTTSVNPTGKALPVDLQSHWTDKTKIKSVSFPSGSEKGPLMYIFQFYSKYE